MTNPLDKQVGGNHYKGFNIQPIEFFMANNIPYAEAAIIKYVLRYRMKDGKTDLLKAKHLIEILLDQEPFPTKKGANSPYTFKDFTLDEDGDSLDPEARKRGKTK